MSKMKHIFRGNVKLVTRDFTKEELELIEKASKETLKKYDEYGNLIKDK